jgi:hypothetical protein
MGEHSVHEINDLLSHKALLFAGVFQQNRPEAALHDHRETTEIYGNRFGVCRPINYA